jgi:hypothetical protein
MSRPELDAMGQNGKRFYEQQLCFSVVAGKFEKIFQACKKS